MVLTVLYPPQPVLVTLEKWGYVNSFRLFSLSMVPSFVACTKLYLNTCFLYCQGGSPRHIPTSAELDRKLAETDAYLQMLIEQVKVHSGHTFSLVCLQVKVPSWNFVSSTFQMSNLMSQISKNFWSSESDLYELANLYLQHFLSLLCWCGKWPNSGIGNLHSWCEISSKIEAMYHQLHTIFGLIIHTAYFFLGLGEEDRNM